MQVTTEQVDPCKVALTISIEPEKVKAQQEKVFNRFARELSIPGFRKGKVPPQMARAYIDPDRVRQRAVEQLVGPAYVEALKETETQPFGGLDPEFELVEMPDDGALVFKAFVPLSPVVTLGPYKGLSLEKRRINVTDKDVANQLEQILSRQAEYPPITDRSAQIGDVIFAEVSTKMEDDEEQPEPQPAFIEIGKNIEDFDNGIVGMNAGESRTIEATYPEDFQDENLRGKKATFTVKVSELRAKVLPELTEEFVQKIHPTAKNADELHVALRESLEKAAVEMSENDLEFRLVGAIVNTSQVNFPDALLRTEMQADIQSLQERLKQENATFEQYLESTGKTAQDVEAEMATAADRRIRNSLVLAEVARQEQLTLEESDIERVIAARAERAKVSPAAVRAYAEKNDQMRMFQDQALTEKILSFLKESSLITERETTVDELENEMDEEETTEMAEHAEAAPLSVAAARTIRRRKAGEESPVSGQEETPAENLTESMATEGAPASVENDEETPATA